MRSILSTIAITIVCSSLQAQSTGRIQGKVTFKNGKPVPNAVVVLKMSDRAWTKEVKTNADGAYLQIGLEPKEFDVSVKVEGYSPYLFNKLKISLGESTIHNIVILTPDETLKEAIASGKVKALDKSAELDAEGSSAFNQAVSFFNEKNYVGALPLMEKAHTSLVKSLAEAKDEKGKTAVQDKLTSVEKNYAFCAYYVGRDDQAQRKDLWAKAEPILAGLFEKNPKDLRYAEPMVEISRAKGDQVAAKKYQDAIDAVTGPNPKAIYNEAVDAFNAGKMPEAKAALEKTLALDPKYADAYYLLGMAEYGLGNLKGTKEALTKYLELAPTGKEAGNVRDMLKDPSLKNIK
jgi:hypothetical protein